MAEKKNKKRWLVGVLISACVLYFLGGFLTIWDLTHSSVVGALGSSLGLIALGRPGGRTRTERRRGLQEERVETQEEFATLGTRKEEMELLANTLEE